MGIENLVRKAQVQNTRYIQGAPTWSLYNAYCAEGTWGGGYGGGNCHANGSTGLADGVIVVAAKTCSLQTPLLMSVDICVQQSSGCVGAVAIVAIGPGEVAVCTTVASGCTASVLEWWSSRFRSLLRTRRIAIMVPLLPTIFLYFWYSLANLPIFDNVILETGSRDRGDPSSWSLSPSPRVLKFSRLLKIGKYNKSILVT